MATCAIGCEPALAFVVEDRFRHDGAGGVAGTEEKNVVCFIRHCAPNSTVSQHPGAQQGTLGFVARMNALRNLPSTCGAISSTATPASVRNTRASSMS